jgi:addiction module HigA family antidote
MMSKRGMTSRKGTMNRSGAVNRPRKTSRAANALLPLVTPGEILLEEFLKPMRLSQNVLARATHVPPRRINEIVLGLRAVTADTDLRLAKYFGMSEGFFVGLQIDHDLRARKREISKELLGIAARHAAE